METDINDIAGIVGGIIFLIIMLFACGNTGREN